MSAWQRSRIWQQSLAAYRHRPVETERAETMQLAPHTWAQWPSQEPLYTDSFKALWKIELALCMDHTIAHGSLRLRCVLQP